MIAVKDKFQGTPEDDGGFRLESRTAGEDSERLQIIEVILRMSNE